jgi:ABC-type molybdate transport system substrate-binding protein
MIPCCLLFKKTKIINPLLFVLVFLCLVLLPFSAHAGQKLSAAVVAGFMSPFQEIAAAFERETGIHIEVSFTSAGRIYAQIENGARMIYFSLPMLKGLICFTENPFAKNLLFMPKVK